MLMPGQEVVPYYLKLTRLYLYILILVHFTPYYLRHYIKRNYRDNIVIFGSYVAQIGVQRKRRHIALYDAIYNIVLDGYRELTGQRLDPHVGYMVGLGVDFVMRLDKHVDMQLKNNTLLQLDETLKAPELQELLTVFRRWIRQSGQYHLMDPLLKSLVSDYDIYIQSLKTARSSIHFDDILRSAHLDSAFLFRRAIELLCLMNAYKLNETVLNDFYLFGMVCKLSDDIVDIIVDIKRDHPNLLYALLRQNKNECAVFETAVEGRRRLDATWWRKHCPVTYIQYFEYVEHYYNSIRSSKLKLLCDLIFLPVVLGFDLMQSQKRKGAKWHE
jgi:hypothetical protein